VCLPGNFSTFEKFSEDSDIQLARQPPTHKVHLSRSAIIRELQSQHKVCLPGNCLSFEKFPEDSEHKPHLSGSAIIRELQSQHKVCLPGNFSTFDKFPEDSVIQLLQIGHNEI
jgi:hypothetical protein